MTPLEYAQLAGAVIGAFAVIATRTPNVSKNPLVQAALTFINAFGMNWGKAANAEPKSLDNPAVGDHSLDDPGEPLD